MMCLSSCLPTVRRLPAALLLALAACGGDTPPDAAHRGAAAASGTPGAPRIPPPSLEPERSPDTYRVRFETSKGAFVVQVKRSLAPRGADRFHELVRIGYFTGVRFFRLVPNFVVQFGIHGDPAVNNLWDTAAIPDDPIRSSNADGTIAFAASGANTRATQLFINTGNNARKLDGQRVFSPFGTVVEGMAVVRALNAEYGEEPNPARIVRQGNGYLQKWFPALDSIATAVIEPTVPTGDPPVRAPRE
ncbi:MAG: peptidylprolyl isomerase [Gemmatimonas sp.]|jgi:cyclophilin family peptidyl-prolyl cis-trans isomerase|uniref:peptidylprolyl isomerase n=2 Tax=Gemmatimonas sp. TaxID=1962908 RepID=UPI00391F03DB